MQTKSPKNSFGWANFLCSSAVQDLVGWIPADRLCSSSLRRYISCLLYVKGLFSALEGENINNRFVGAQKTSKEVFLEDLLGWGFRGSQPHRRIATSSRSSLRCRKRPPARFLLIPWAAAQTKNRLVGDFQVWRSWGCLVEKKGSCKKNILGFWFGKKGRFWCNPFLRSPLSNKTLQEEPAKVRKL